MRTYEKYTQIVILTKFKLLTNGEEFYVTIGINCVISLSSLGA